MCGFHICLRNKHPYTLTSNSLIPPLHTHKHTHTHTHTPTHTHTHTHLVGPVFHLSQYQFTEGETEVVCLSARILTKTQAPPFTGSIEVDITVEDLPSGDRRENAEFGKCYLFVGN